MGAMRESEVLGETQMVTSAFLQGIGGCSASKRIVLGISPLRMHNVEVILVFFRKIFENIYKSYVFNLDATYVMYVPRV